MHSLASNTRDYALQFRERIRRVSRPKRPPLLNRLGKRDKRVVQKTGEHRRLRASWAGRSKIEHVRSSDGPSYQQRKTGFFIELYGALETGDSNRLVRLFRKNREIAKRHRGLIRSLVDEKITEKASVALDVFDARYIVGLARATRSIATFLPGLFDGNVVAGAFAREEMIILRGVGADKLVDRYTDAIPGDVEGGFGAIEAHILGFLNSTLKADFNDIDLPKVPGQTTVLRNENGGVEISLTKVLHRKEIEYKDDTVVYEYQYYGLRVID